MWQACTAMPLLFHNWLLRPQCGNLLSLLINRAIGTKLNYQMAISPGFTTFILLMLIILLMHGVVQINDPLVTVYESPDTDTLRLGSLVINTRLPLLEKRDNWLKIKFPDGRNGWISAQKEDDLPQGTESLPLVEN